MIVVTGGERLRWPCDLMVWGIRRGGGLGLDLVSEQGRERSNQRGRMGGKFQQANQGLHLHSKTSYLFSDWLRGSRGERPNFSLALITNGNRLERTASETLW